MKIIEFGEEWNKFFIPVERGSQPEEKYISKLNKILDKFYQENSVVPEEAKYMKYKLKKFEENPNNFVGMFLKTQCDVKYTAIEDKFNLNSPGIYVWSHQDIEHYRKPMINYLKEKWSELEVY
jgi:hypothetical protein